MTFGGAVKKCKDATNGAMLRGHPLLTRLIEAAIIGGIVLWGTVQVQGAKIESMTVRLIAVEKKIDKFFGDFYAPKWKSEMGKTLFSNPSDDAESSAHGGASSHD